MGCKIQKLVTWPWPRPFRGRFVTDRLGRAMTNLRTEFEVPVFTRYGNMTGVAKCRKWGGLGWLFMGHPRSLKIALFDRAHMSCYWPSVESSLCPYLAPFLRYSEILVEKRRCEPTPPLFGAQFGVMSLEFDRDFWHRKTRVPGLSLVWS